MILEEKYDLSTDENGLVVITITGRCTHDEAAAIESGCTLRYQMVPLPHAQGAILKTMDGTIPMLSIVTPPTIGLPYTCVKVRGRVNPLAYVQEEGPFAGFAILKYEMVYQQVGGVT